jgi:hypothetical protein
LLKVEFKIISLDNTFLDLDDNTDLASPPPVTALSRDFVPVSSSTALSRDLVDFPPEPTADPERAY